MIRTRFAPSPTGYLHIGGVRTALFNWLFARRHGGRFILRIDDTDQVRNVSEALQPILDGFRWLGIDWDEGADVGGDFGPYHQSQRLDRYQSAVQTLIERGLAYADYATPEEIREEREAAQAKKLTFIYSRKWMAESDADKARFESEGRAGVVRLKMPRDGACRFNDLIRGEVEVAWSHEHHVIQRADGSCLYHLASVVDDHDMEISHVIRAAEHLSNTPRQVFIAEGLGYELPEYAHVPVVAEPGSKNKLSKRKLEKYLKNQDFAKFADHGRSIAAAIGLETSSETFNPVIVDFYREVGYLPDAIINYLLLLGWSLDDRTEFMTRQEMVDNFTLDRVNKAPASFDPQKLMAFQDQYMRAHPLDDKVRESLPYLTKAGLIGSPSSADVESRVAKIHEAAGDRIKVAGDILDYADFFVPDDALTYEEKAVAKWIRKPPNALELLGKLKTELEAAPSFEIDSLDAQIRAYVESHDVKLGLAMQVLRVATTGKGVGFGLFESLNILGRKRCLARIERMLAGL